MRLLFFATMGLTLFAGEPAAERPPTANRAEEAWRFDVETLNSFGCALFELAGERYAQHSAVGERWVLTWHAWGAQKGLVKLTDGRWTVVSIPVHDFQVLGVANFASHYNSWVLRTADQWLVAGKVKEAKEAYQLLGRFWMVPDKAEWFAQRLAYVQRLERGERLPPAKEVLPCFAEDLGSSMMAGMETMKATTVTNLLTVPHECPRIPEP